MGGVGRTRASNVNATRAWRENRRGSSWKNKHLTNHILINICRQMIGQSRSIIFFGSDAFSLACLRELCRLEVQVTGVVPIAKSMLHSKAEELGLPKVDPEMTEFDFGLVASYGKFIPRRIIAKARMGMLNVHPSMLPEWRGPAPIQRSIMNGSRLGVSIIDVHPKVIDAGEIYSQRLLGTETISFKEAEEQLAVLGAQELFNVMQNYDTTKKSPQEGEATYAGPITNKESAISFANMTSEDIYRTHLAISHQETLRCHSITRELFIKDMSGFDPDTNLKVGEVFYDRAARLLKVGAKTGSVNIRSGVLKGKSTLLDAGGIVSALGLKNHQIGFL